MGIPSHSKTRELIDDLLKGSVLLYVLGYLVVNINLLKYGFMVTDFTSPRYFAAGLMLLLVCLTQFASVLSLERMGRSPFEAITHSVVLSTLLLSWVLRIPFLKANSHFPLGWTAYAALAIPVLLILGLPRLAKLATGARWLAIVLKAFVVTAYLEYCVLYTSEGLIALAGFLAALAALAITYPLTRVRKSFSLNHIDQVHDLVWLAAGAFGLLGIFGGYVYHTVPRIRGGGAAQIADVTLRKDFHDPNVLTQASIIYETANSIYVSLPNVGRTGRQALEIPRWGVVSVHYSTAKQEQAQ